jgi:hypothetical protein
MSIKSPFLRIYKVFLLYSIKLSSVFTNLINVSEFISIYITRESLFVIVMLIVLGLHSYTEDV